MPAGQFSIEKRPVVIILYTCINRIIAYFLNI